MNEQVKRNHKRFPVSFMFKLSATEWAVLQSQTATTIRRMIPFVFTE
ncbi:MAG: ORF6N domain-containing protein [Bacteroidetes bacterium]|nr:ORF6N domain-containing protein [Bacteroidota bacterium]